ncbi:MAG: VWA domain-containing protein [Epsilonproteobacteria bacterium]|nr:VWA domain-containing protein [Campylobacterota bacterium]
MTLLYPTFLWLLLPLGILIYRSKQKVTTLVHLIILILLVLTLARPVQEDALQEANIEAKDIVIALDVSFSMRATDISPNRYDFAKETIKLLLAKNPADNIMLIDFTTKPLLLSPPTTDHTLINIALQSLNPKHILTKGTSMKALFTRLKKMDMGEKNLILITDGGEETDLARLQNLVQASKLSLITLGLGSKKGTTIAKKDGTMVKDKEGHLVISRLNPLLKSLSDAVGGSYITPSSTPEATADALSDALIQHTTQTQNVKKMQRIYKELYQIPLGLALLLFLLLHTRGVKYLFIFFALLGVQLHASFLDDYYLDKAYKNYDKQQFVQSKEALQHIEFPSLQSQIALANNAYKLGAYKKAIALYKSIRSTSPSVKQQLYYNIGNAYAMQKAYDKAKIYYTKALQLGNDVDAAYNLACIALLHDSKEGALGISHPKSQGGASSKSEMQEDKKKKKQEEDAPSSGSGGGGEKSMQKKKNQKEQKKNKLLMDVRAKPQPLGSKAYELINKGYIHENHPW